MFRLFLGAFSCASLLFVGCSPTDQNVFSYQERLNSGKPIFYNQQGEIPEGCRNRAWTEARLHPETAEDLVFAKSNLEIKSGWDNCYQVGSLVDVVDPNDKKTVLFQAQVRWILIAKPKGDGRDFQSDFEKVFKVEGRDKAFVSYYKDKIQGRLASELEFSRERRDGILQVTSFKYIPQSAPQQLEASYIQKARSRYESSFFEETQKDGDVLKSCGAKKFTDYRTTRATWELMQSGLTATAWEVHPGLLCAPQGSEVTLVSNDVAPDGSRETFGKIKIGKMRRMKIESFKSSFLNLKGMDIKEAMDRIEDAYNQKKKDKNARLFLFDFEVVP